MSERRRQSRGQAVVELALGLLVFVTILLFGIHFAEVGYLSLKTTEAASAALFDATALKQHDWPNDASPASAAATSAASEAQARYQGFDGRESAAGGAGITQLLTQGAALKVKCKTGNGPGFDPGPHTSMAYSDNGGITCGSSATLESIRIPTHFVDQGTKGLFQVPHLVSRPLKVCAVGRDWGGTCQGQLAMLIDDWGLSGSKETGTCPLIPNIPAPCPTNLPYWEMASAVYATNGMAAGVAGSALAMFTVQRMPFPFFFGAENMFWMSATTELDYFMQPLTGENGSGYQKRLWTTTPGGDIGLASGGITGGIGGVLGGLANGPALAAYGASFLTRDDCFLGTNC